MNDLDIATSIADLAQHCCSHSFSMEVHTHNRLASGLILTYCSRTHNTMYTQSQCAQCQSHNGVPKYHNAQYRLSQHAQELLSDLTKSSHRHTRAHHTLIAHSHQSVRVQRHPYHISSRSPSKSIHQRPTSHAQLALRTPTIQTMETRTFRSRSSSSTLMTHHPRTRQLCGNHIARRFYNTYHDTLRLWIWTRKLRSRGCMQTMLGSRLSGWRLWLR